MPTLTQLAADLAAGRTTSEELVEACLDRIADPDGEGRLAYLEVDGTPANPWDRSHRRIPGGSSSGAAVSVTDGIAHGALGSDTCGSCRIPAALCGLVGFKPTQARVPRHGMIPLSSTLDAVGVLGRSVRCCAALDALLRDDELAAPEAATHPPRLAACATTSRPARAARGRL